MSRVGGGAVVAQVGGGGQALMHNFWGAMQLCGCTTRWWRKLVVAQVVVAQVVVQVVAQV